MTYTDDILLNNYAHEYDEHYYDRKYFVKQRRQHSRNKNDNYPRQSSIFANLTWYAIIIKYELY